MLPILAYLLAFAVLVVGISLAVQYSRYQRWGPYEWRQRLLDHAYRLHSRRDRLNEAAGEFDEQIERLSAAHFAKHLLSIPLERLSEFPGIGSATLERLEHAGCRNINDVVHLRPDSIRGIGPSRAN